MATQSKTDSTLNSKQSTGRVIAARTKVLRLSVAMALVVLVGTAHADLLVSNYDHGAVDKYKDDGTIKEAGFLTGVTFAEGVQCVKRSQNLVYVGNSHSGEIKVYDLLTGEHYSGQDFTINGASSVIALAMDASASVLYCG